MDTYPPIFDAVRSRLSNCDVGAAVQDAIRGAGLDHAAAQAAESIRQAAASYERPSVLYRPKIYPDGNQWCALYGDNLQEGVAGFGDSPAEAVHDFDSAWYTKLSKHG